MEDKDIVWVDATVIAGALIFLGVFSVSFGSSFAGFADFAGYVDPYSPTLISVLGLNPFGIMLSTTVIVPHAFSAILATLGRTRSAKIAMIVGFAVLAIFLSIISAFTILAWP